MKLSWIKIMKETGRLKLSKWQLFWHFSIVPFIMIIPIMSAFAIFQIEVTGTYTGVRTAKEHFDMGWPWLIPAIIFAVIQYRRLDFKKIDISLTSEEFKKITKAAGDEMNWTMENVTNDIVIATTGFTWASWGERVTIVRDTNFILINSICDPDNRPSVSSWGRNRKNIEAFRKRIKASAQQQV